MPAENEQSIKGILGWYQAKLFTPSQQIFKILYEPSAFSSPPNQDTYNKWRNDIVDLLSALDDKLVASAYLCADKMTIGDIVVFNELS